MKKLCSQPCCFAIMMAAASPASRQDCPQQPIRIIVSFGPGGGADIIARILADAMQTRLGKPVVVENKPGAGGIIGNEAVAALPPDGYTLGIMTAGQIIAAVTRKNMPYDTLTCICPGRPDRHRQLVDRDASGFSGQQREGTGRGRQGRSRQDRVREPRLCRHPAFRRRDVQADRQGGFAARSLQDLAGSHQRGPRQTCRYVVRHGIGPDRPGAVRPAQGARGNRQGSLSGGAGCAGRKRIRRCCRATT